MKDFIDSSALTRLLANVFMFAILLACIFAAVVEVLRGEQINPLVYTLLSLGATYSVTLLGAHVGGVLALTQPKQSSSSKPINELDTAKIPSIKLGDTQRE